MSLPFGFSPFDDDYDSPYAHTNAAIRRQSRSGVPLPSGQSQHSNASSQLGSPFSSRQQAQSQPQSRSPTRPSSRGQLNASTTGDALNEPLPTRKSSPPPEIPAAEDFGSNKRFPQQASRSPSGDVRAITQPTPMGAPLAAAFASSEDKQSSPPKVTPVAVTPPQSPSKSPPASPSPSQRRRPPPPPAATAAPRATPPSSPLAGSASPKKTDKSVKDSTDKKQKTDKAAKKNESAASAAATKSTTQPTPSSSSRWSWIKGSSAKAAAPAAGAAAAVAATKGKGKSPESEEAAPPAPPSSTPASPPSPKTAAPVAAAASTPAAKPAVSQSSPPAPVVHDLPEPAAPPAPAQVALATPADQAAEQQQQQQPEQQVPTTTSPAPQAQEMHEIGRSDSDSNNKPTTPFAPVTPMTSIGDNSDVNGARDHHSTSPLSSPSEGPAVSRTSFSSTRSHRRGLGAVGAGAGIGAAAAATAGTAGTAFAADRNARPAHTAYDMGDNSASSPFSEKADNPREPLAGSGAAGLPTHNAKRNNEGSRFSHANSYSAAGAGAGGGALARSWRNHKKAWIIGGIIALIVIIAAAVGGGVGGSSSSSGKGTTNGGGNGQDKGTGSGGTGIKADSRLHNSFFGINYTPFQSLAPACGVNITGVVDDLKLISQLTSRVRLAGSACNETAMVLDAIQRLDVDLTVYPSIAITDATTLVSTDWTNQVNFVTDAMNTFGTDRIGGVQVADDYITNIGSQATLLRFVEAFRTALAGSSGLANVPVGTAEASSTWSASLVQSVDFVFANNQAWYSGIAINNAASWTASYFQSTIGDMLDDVTNAPPAFISETGWPTGAFTQAQATEDAAIASVANLQTYLDTFICQANTNGTGYFFFEMFDDPNLANAAGGVGGYWGLFDSDKNLKDITIPKCSHR